MRKYPAKCPECKEYAEPVFDNLSSHYYQSGATWTSHTNVEPTGWYCPYCKIDFQEEKKEKDYEQ